MPAAPASADTRFRVIPGHIHGPAVTDTQGHLVDNCPSVESAERIAAALEELLVTGNLGWSLPTLSALETDETERVIRYLAKRARRAEHPDG